MKTSVPMLYRASRWMLRAALGFYFTRIERFHAERVPARAPVLFASNHPNSLTDAFVIGTSVPRKVNFVATVRLFQWRPLAWLLTQCGVISINRVKDDPRGMRSVLQTFEACYQVLERGEAVAIFPEGITHDDPQLKTVKSGTARMALEFQHRHEGWLSLEIVPVGLTFSAKDTYRSAALVNFGEPISVLDYLTAYVHDRHKGIQALSAELEHRIQTLMFHLPQLERARIIEAVKRLYLDRLRVGQTVIHEPMPPQASELLLTQTITNAVDFTFNHNPKRAAAFERKLGHYENALRRLHLPEEVLAQFPDRTRILRRSVSRVFLAILLAPVAVYGWAHRLVPYLIVQWIVGKAAKTPADRTHVSTATILGGLIVFSIFYAFCAFIFHLFFGLRATMWYAVSLPIASLLAHYYLRDLRRLTASVRAATVLLLSPRAARRLQEWRSELISMIEAAHADYERQSLGQNAPL